jgi:tRNA U38,U39,U40 pseudouridine synthase TruA
MLVQLEDSNKVYLAPTTADNSYGVKVVGNAFSGKMYRRFLNDEFHLAENEGESNTIDKVVFNISKEAEITADDETLYLITFKDIKYKEDNIENIESEVLES